MVLTNLKFGKKQNNYPWGNMMILKGAIFAPFKIKIKQHVVSINFTI